jgi:hypothetical protein
MHVTKIFRYIIVLSTTFTLFAANACKKDEPEPEPTPTPIVQQPWDLPFSASSPTFFKATINGANVQKTGESGSGWDFSIGSISHATYGSSLSDSEGNFIASVDIGRLYLPNGGYPGENAIRSYAREGSYTFGVPDSPSLSTYNVDVQYQDASGVNWSSYFGAGTQTLSATCTITDTLHTTFFDGSNGIKFRATYNCTLYKLDGTATMSLTNGIYVGYFSEY